MRTSPDETFDAEDAGPLHSAEPEDHSAALEAGTRSTLALVSDASQH